MSGLKQTGIVLSANKFDFENDAKERVQGCTVRAIMTNNLAPYEDRTGKPIKGRSPAKFSFPVETYDNRIVDAPGLYEFDMELSVDSKGNMKAVPFDLTFMKPLVAKQKV